MVEEVEDPGVGVVAGAMDGARLLVLLRPPDEPLIDFRYAQVCMRLGQIAKSAVWCRPGSSDGRAT